MTEKKGKTIKRSRPTNSKESVKTLKTQFPSTYVVEDIQVRLTNLHYTEEDGIVVITANYTEIKPRQ